MAGSGTERLGHSMRERSTTLTLTSDLRPITELSKPIIPEHRTDEETGTINRNVESQWRMGWARYGLLGSRVGVVNVR